jgi:hypothetical protein
VPTDQATIGLVNLSQAETEIYMLERFRLCSDHTFSLQPSGGELNSSAVLEDYAPSSIGWTVMGIVYALACPLINAHVVQN